MIIKINRYKHSRGKGAEIKLKRQASKHLCPVRALRSYQKVRVGKAKGFFINEKGRPLTKNAFASLLKKVSVEAGFETPYLSHCYRIGAATEAHRIGYTEVQIKALGRWRSTAYAGYVKGSKPLELNGK